MSLEVEMNRAVNTQKCFVLVFFASISLFTLNKPVRSFAQGHAPHSDPVSCLSTSVYYQIIAKRPKIPPQENVATWKKTETLLCSNEAS